MNYTVSSLSEFINIIFLLSSNSTSMLYRGQSNAEWEVTSSAYRALVNYPCTPKVLCNYHKQLIESAILLHDSELKGLDGLSLLVHLQHRGAKTMLIDYTRNPLVALWFACMDTSQHGQNYDGIVYILDEGNGYNTHITELECEKTINDLFNEDVEIVYKLTPPNLNRRILAQQSTFLLSTLGKIESYRHLSSILVIKDDKKEILSQLMGLGISTESLFPDFTGYTMWFNYHEDKNDVRQYEIIEKEADNLFEIKKLEYALEKYSMILDYFKSKFGENHPYTARIYYKIGHVYREQGKYELSENYYEQSLKIREGIFGSEHPGVATQYVNMGICCLKQKKFDDAIEWYMKAVEIQKKAFGLAHPKVAESYFQIGLAYLSKKNNEEARKWFEEAIIIYEQMLGKGHLDTAYVYFSLAQACRQNRNYNEALELSLKAYRVFIIKLGKENMNTKEAYKEMALCCSERIGYQSFEHWISNMV